MQKKETKKTKNSAPWVYSETVKKHFFSPKNLLKEGEDTSLFDGKGEAGSMVCGDLMHMWITVKQGKIKKCKWRTFGCASAIASTSMLSEMVTEKGGMTLEDAEKIRPMDIVARLGGLPTNKIHCSVLGDQALRDAINDYRKKTENKKQKK